MGYFEDKKRELEELLNLLNQEKTRFEEYSKNEKNDIAKKIAWDEKLFLGVKQMAKERQIGFPWLAKAYVDFFKLQDRNLIDFLK